ncbi:hypothetical protein M8C21_022127 [Ambrosia artemisiifolia]|uniref:Uncharacterized protein n=1 Tax=Ambrosia artemisiifolia TaxID=4212 RepID=A0AAD5GF41_AMBAR|nr:hypothetical protein M8C21_022127 [Ambrosia artemisiifolia]
MYVSLRILSTPRGLRQWFEKTHCQSLEPRFGAHEASYYTATGTLVTTPWDIPYTHCTSDELSALVCVLPLPATTLLQIL